MAGVALSTLTNNPSAFCNGFNVQCYKSTCEQGMRQCTATNSTRLITAGCPDSRFTECWQSEDTLFQCFGRRRPSFRNEDVVSVCHTPELVGASPQGSAATSPGTANTLRVVSPQRVVVLFDTDTDR
eukprot:gene2759-3053_t